MQLTIKDGKIAEQGARINAIRNRYRSAPLTDSQSVKFQHTVDDNLNMQETADNYDAITHMRTPGGDQLWKDYDNVIRQYTKVDFIAKVTELRELKAALVAEVFEHTEGVKALLPLADDHAVFSDAYWTSQFGDIE